MMQYRTRMETLMMYNFSRLADVVLLKSSVRAEDVKPGNIVFFFLQLRAIYLISPLRSVGGTHLEYLPCVVWVGHI